MSLCCTLMAAAVWCTTCGEAVALFGNSHMDNVYILDCIPSEDALLQRTWSATREEATAPRLTGLQAIQMPKVMENTERYQTGSKSHTSKN